MILVLFLDEIDNADNLFILSDVVDLAQVYNFVSSDEFGLGAFSVVSQREGEEKEEKDCFVHEGLNEM